MAAEVRVGAMERAGKGAWRATMLGAGLALATLIGLGDDTARAAGGGAAADGPVVRIAGGLVVGAASDGVEVYRALPYAAAPVGDLRWRPPQPAPAWRGVRAATRAGNICLQPAHSKIAGTQSEDCLTLDVFTAARGKARPAPVLVWIHGGGFTEGTGQAPEFDGHAFAKAGVVLVNINYRLGRLGFFAHPALTREAGGKPGANYGLMDQIAALRWVKANIAAFGGDPSQVTIAGASAGGASVNALMVSPAARGFFQRAISQSGLGREHTQDLATAEATGAALARRWGVSDGADEAGALRAVPAATIIGAEPDDLNVGVLNGDFPIIDGWILPQPVFAAFEAGREAPVPWIVGATDLELPLAVQPPSLKARVPAWADLPPALKAVYPDQTRYASQFPSDLIFLEPSVALARLHARRAPTFVYRFAITADAVQAMFGGAFHSSEQYSVFQTYDTAPYPLGQRDRTLGATVGAYWAGFVRTGDPDGSDRPAWPRFEADRIMTFTNAGPSPGVDPSAARLAAVRDAVAAGQAPVLVGPAPDTAAAKGGRP